MSGGGRNDYFGSNRPISDLRDAALRSTRDEASEAAINGYLAQLLATINDRDTEKVRAYLADVLTVLDVALEAVETTLFGGSVAKRTYVEGLSDVDVLLALDPSIVGEASPQSLKETVAAALRTNLPAGDVERVETGTLAVTIDYRDGTQIQLLPALRQANGSLRIASATGDGWTRIDPRPFSRKLTQINEANGGRVIPLVKLAKQLIASYPETRSLSGYHIESLAIQAFRGYEGPRSLSRMLTHFFKSAASTVLAPIRDSSGQSMHVDDYLGDHGSLERRLRSDSLARTARRLETANTDQQWRDILQP